MSLNVRMFTFMEDLFRLLAGSYVLPVSVQAPLGLDGFETTSAFGVNIDRAVASNFFLGSAVAGTAGVLVGFYYNSVYPTMGSVPVHKAMAIAVMGSLGNVWGDCDRIAHPRPCRDVPCHIPAGVHTSQGFHPLVALILVLLFRPHGLSGRR